MVEFNLISFLLKRFMKNVLIAHKKYNTSELLIQMCRRISFN